MSCTLVKWRQRDESGCPGLDNPMLDVGGVEDVRNKNAKLQINDGFG